LKFSGKVGLKEGYQSKVRTEVKAGIPVPFFPSSNLSFQLQLYDQSYCLQEKGITAGKTFLLHQVENTYDCSFTFKRQGDFVDNIFYYNYTELEGGA
jgi:hypothetical protein